MNDEPNLIRAIETTGLSTGSAATRHLSGQSIRGWVRTHGSRLDAGLPDGDELTTSWVARKGPLRTRTTRERGETDLEFVARHKIDFALDMLRDAPRPPAKSD